MKAVIFILVLLLVAAIEMIVLLYRAYKKIANSQIQGGGLKMAEQKPYPTMLTPSGYKYRCPDCGGETLTLGNHFYCDKCGYEIELDTVQEVNRNE